MIAARADRQRKRVVARIASAPSILGGARLSASELADEHELPIDELAVDWKVSRPGTRVVALVGCGKSKATSPAKARDLYTSPLFRKSLELAEVIADATFVASARAGLLELDAVVAPYDSTLTLDKHAADAWARDLLKDLVLHHTLATPTPIRLVLFMGERYAAPIKRVVEELRRVSSLWEVTDLLRGLEIGDRLAFLNRAIPFAKLRRGDR